MHSPVASPWKFTFRQNVHMFSHDLRAAHGATEYQIPCEDTVVDEVIGVWPYDLKIDGEVYRSLIDALVRWATAEELRCRIYTTSSSFIPVNDP